jgi:hypothetical protein
MLRFTDTVQDCVKCLIIWPLCQMTLVIVNTTTSYTCQVPSLMHLVFLCRLCRLQQKPVQHLGDH